MPLDSRLSASRRSPLLEAAIVARRYYIDNKQKSEIADELGISRFKVARLLDDARAQGLVHIQVDMPAELDLPLGDRLAARFGLSRAVVVNTADSSVDMTTYLLGQACADLLEAFVDVDDVLGITWGATLTRVADALSTLPQCTLVQLVGGVSSVDLNVSGVELLRRIGSKTNGPTHALHAPLLVRNAAVASDLRAEPEIASTLSKCDSLTAALVGIGSWNENSTFYAHVDETEREEFRTRGAVADMCALVFDGNGELLEGSLSERTIGISAEQLRKVPDVIAVAGGADKVPAIRAALASGIPNTLVTDSITAETLLADA
ncbi:DNA-binding transcriptional regulator LsrR, DeoR family [Paramicrobacterium humi]|uniref:DNA-binding transcriptional regulator LsrR, DeoR family n=1 Tax=Paramicrobacterium humi TaxID=640635 RepID=A0A1H4L8A2_9MICO|nr:sugar-binding transcriptional regulator [Microbacterium humi]SEB66951.1 DNA-binding transcriptional regulator LsrR, DeoR family [Microbacterium humi]